MVTLLRLLWLLLMDTAPPKTKEKKEGDEEEEEEEDEDEDVEKLGSIRDPERHALSQEAGKWRRKFRAAEARIKELEEDKGDGGDELRSSRLETAFLHTVLDYGEAIDVETTWTLGNSRGFLDTVKVNDDGEVEGMSGALEKVLDRYPWLADDRSSASDPPSDGELGRRTAPPPKRPKDQSGQQISRGQLQDRFPALRRHGR